MDPSDSGRRGSVKWNYETSVRLYGYFYRGTVISTIVLSCPVTRFRINRNYVNSDRKRIDLSSWNHSTNIYLSNKDSTEEFIRALYVKGSLRVSSNERNRKRRCWAWLGKDKITIRCWRRKGRQFQIWLLSRLSVDDFRTGRGTPREKSFSIQDEKFEKFPIRVGPREWLFIWPSIGTRRRAKVANFTKLSPW